MTFTTYLKSTTVNGFEISASKEVAKFSAVEEYQITVARDGIAREVIPAARTTWAKRFKQVVEEYK